MRPKRKSHDWHPASPSPAPRRRRRGPPTDRRTARGHAPSEAPAHGSLGGVRLQKLLAAAGLGSRREIEEWITDGRLTVAGRTAVLGQRVRAGEAIHMDGKPVAVPVTTGQVRVLAYHKPVGEIVTRSDPGERATVFDALPPIRGGKWIAVGRLDVNTSGLLLVTDSGELANRLMHPRYGLVRGYAVRVRGSLDEGRRRRLLTGIRLEDGLARFDSLKELGRGTDHSANRWYQITIREGRYREVRRLLEAVGCTVSRLVRTQFGPISLPRDMPAGAWRELSRAEVSHLWGSQGPANAD